MVDTSSNSLDPKVIENLRFLRDDEHDYLGELIDVFLSESPRLLDTLRARVSSDDIPGTQKTAHTFKGSSAALGAKKLAEYCKELEMLARSGTLAGAQEWLQKIETEFGRVQVALAAEKQRDKSA